MFVQEAFRSAGGRASDALPAGGSRRCPSISHGRSLRCPGMKREARRPRKALITGSRTLRNPPHRRDPAVARPWQERESQPEISADRGLHRPDRDCRAARRGTEPQQVCDLVAARRPPADRGAEGRRRERDQDLYLHRTMQAFTGRVAAPLNQPIARAVVSMLAGLTTGIPGCRTGTASAGCWQKPRHRHATR